MMTEEQIERRVELATDSIDRRYMNTDMTTAEYEVEMGKLNEWAEQQYDMLAKVAP